MNRYTAWLAPFASRVHCTGCVGLLVMMSVIMIAPRLGTEAISWPASSDEVTLARRAPLPPEAGGGPATHEQLPATA